MKKIYFCLFSLFVFALAFTACPGTPESSVDFSFAEKLEGKTFNSFSTSIEIENTIIFGSLDKIQAILPLTFNGENLTLDVKSKKIDNKALSTISLNNSRDFENSFIYDGKTYEQCSQEYKYAKLLENSKFQWKYQEGGIRINMEFSNIDATNNTIALSYNSGQENNENHYDRTYYINTKSTNNPDTAWSDINILTFIDINTIDYKDVNGTSNGMNIKIRVQEF